MEGVCCSGRWGGYQAEEGEGRRQHMGRGTRRRGPRRELFADRDARPPARRACAVGSCDLCRVSPTVIDPALSPHSPPTSLLSYLRAPALPMRPSPRLAPLHGRDMRRRLPKGAMLWIRCYPSVPVSKKPLETRMGRGKGGVEFWACAVRPGQMIFELDNVTEAEAKEAFRVAGSFLPMKTGFVEWK